MFRALSLAVAALALTAASARAQSPSCQTVNPGAGFVCVGGQWLPPGHPDIPTTPPPAVDLPKPNQPTPAVPFKIGHRYWRNASGVNPTDIYIAGAGQLEDGITVLFAVCRTTGDGCFEIGQTRLFLSNATAKDWEDRTNSPY